MWPPVSSTYFLKKGTNGLNTVTVHMSAASTSEGGTGKHGKDQQSSCGLYENLSTRVITCGPLCFTYFTLSFERISGPWLNVITSSHLNKCLECGLDQLHYQAYAALLTEDSDIPWNHNKAKLNISWKMYWSNVSSKAMLLRPSGIWAPETEESMDTAHLSIKPRPTPGQANVK